MRRILLLLSVLITAVFAVNAEEYNHTFKNGELAVKGGAVTLSDTLWTSTDANSLGWNNTKGIQIGSKSAACTSYTLKTSAFDGFLIRNVTVYSSVASSGDAKVTIKVGNSTSEEYALTTTNAGYTFNSNCMGDIEISWNATQRAYYVQKIVVDYILPASMVDVEEPTFKTPIGIYQDKIKRVTVETEDQSLVLYYTMDGTDPNYEDFIADKEGCTTATSKTYAMYFEDELALTTTTTIKVLAVKTDGEEVYKSDIVEATYIVSPTKPYVLANETTDKERYAFFANDSISEALHTTVADGYLQGRKINKHDKYIDAVEYSGFIFTATDGGYTIQDETGRYMYANSNGNTFGFAKEKPATGAVWAVTFNKDNATIKNGDRTVYYSKTNDTFGCYTASEVTSDMILPSIFMLREYPQAIITPGTNSTVKDLNEITITCNEGIRAAEGTVLLSYIEETGYKAITFTCSQTDDNTLVFKSNEPVSTIDNVNLHINLNGKIYLNPDGIDMEMPVGIGYYKNAVAEYKLEGNAPAATITDIKPADGEVIEHIGYFLFTFDKVTGWSEDTTKIARLHLEGSEELIPLTFTTMQEGSTSPVQQMQGALTTESPIYTNGTYILEIPDGYFSDRNGRAVKGVTLRYIVKNETGIEEIIAEGEKHWVVYNLTGIKVLDTDNAELLKGLQRGIYIINGKKWIIE